MSTFIVMLGPPGAGKGTQAKRIARELGLPHVSSGDIFRENLKNKTELGELAETYMNRGELVPDGVTIAMIKDRLSREDCGDGAILDGFPRTPAQAKALDQMLSEMDAQVDTVPYINVPDQVLIKRLTGRWTCPECGHMYHEEFNPPVEDLVCDNDGAELYQREDDKPETVKNRISVYREQTQPLIDYYEKQGVLTEIDGDQEISEVTDELLSILS